MGELLKPDDTRDALRKQGGLLLGLAALMIFLRKGGGEHAWADFPLFLLLAAPSVCLYGGGVFTVRETGGLRTWQAVYSVLGLIFVPLALFQFIELIDGDSGAALNVAWVFGATAALAGYAALSAGIRFHLLAGSIALIVAWSALWDKILSGGLAEHFGVYRGLLGILAILLLAAGLYLWRTDAGAEASQAGDGGLWKASELLTGAGISAVIGCSLGISSLPGALSPFITVAFNPVETSLFWDVLLLVISLGLVGLGSLIGVRGPVYVGAVGLFLWLLIAGFDLDGNPPEPNSFGVWPIVLLLGGALGVGLSFVEQASLGDEPRKRLEQLREK